MVTLEKNRRIGQQQKDRKDLRSTQEDVQEHLVEPLRQRIKEILVEADSGEESGPKRGLGHALTSFADRLLAVDTVAALTDSRKRRKDDHPEVVLVQDIEDRCEGELLRTIGGGRDGHTSLPNPEEGEMRIFFPTFVNDVWLRISTRGDGRKKTLDLVAVTQAQLAAQRPGKGL